MFRPFTRVLVFADGDDAGRDLGKQIARDVPQAVVLRMPDGADVTDTFLAEGVDGLAERAGL
jgi:DNA primase